MTTYNQLNDPLFRGNESSVSRTSVPIVTSDAVDLASYPKSVTALTAGTIVALPLKNADGAFVTFGAVLAGYVLPFRVRRINATGTSATLVANYD
jgi:hypothetical protein